MLSYFVQKYNIPVLFNQEYYTEIAQDRFFCDREDFGDKEAQNEIDKLIKFYENEVGHISNKMNFKREESTYENLIKRYKKLKPTNFKYQKIKAWIQQGLEIVTQNFNFYHPYPLFQDDEDNYCFGPELYCNFVWKVDELDPVWNAYDSEIQMYYNEYEIIPFVLVSELTHKKPFLKLKKEAELFPKKYCDWLDSTWLIYEK